MVYKRIFAHEIVCNGVTWHYAVATLNALGEIEIMPYEEETPHTVFVSGAIEVFKSVDGMGLCYRKL